MAASDWLRCIGFASTRTCRPSNVNAMNMTAILARSQLACSQLDPDGSGWRRASPTLDALVSYLDAICDEWATTSEVDRLAAARLAADTARRIQEWVGPNGPGDQP